MLYDGLTAEQYLQFVGRARGLGKQVRQVAVDTLLQVVGLDERRWRDVSAFSPASGVGWRWPVRWCTSRTCCCSTIRCAAWTASRAWSRSKCCASCTDSARRWSWPPRDLRMCWRCATALAVLRDGTLVWSGDASAARWPWLRRSIADARPRTRRAARRARGGADAARPAARPARARSRRGWRNVWFLFTGDQEALANLLPQLIRAGCSVAHFGIERRSPAAALARMFHEESGR